MRDGNHSVTITSCVTGSIRALWTSVKEELVQLAPLVLPVEDVPATVVTTPVRAPGVGVPVAEGDCDTEAVTDEVPVAEAVADEDEEAVGDEEEVAEGEAATLAVTLGEPVAEGLTLEDAATLLLSEAELLMDADDDADADAAAE